MMQQEEHAPHQRVIYLITAVNNHSISDAERGELETWLSASEKNRDLYAELTSEDKKQEAMALMESFDTVRALDLMKERMSMVQAKRGRNLKMWVTAAACLLIIATVALLKTEVFERRSLQDYTMLPEGNKAILITADGKVITLDDRENLIEGGNVKIDTDAGVISYLLDKTGLTDPKKLEYNTIKTPKGGQYEVLLSDGTKVFLNAESTLTYPVQFGAGERRVKLLGEAYFEVSKDREKPFFVESGIQEVKVLGTHFNVQAYQDEEFMTTSLLEGSVQLNEHQRSGRVLVPGEIATYHLKTNRLHVDQIKVSEMALWRSGYFQFTEEPIETVMKKISRWYNVEVVFKGDQTTDLFSGTITHYQKLQDVLATLELTGKVRFKYNGKEVIVDKN